MRRQVRTFHNPVLPGFYPDPSVCRVGQDFYLVTSSFEYFPGVPIFKSRDLVSWRQIGHVLTRKSQLDLTGIKSSWGIFAPTLRHHRGRFYMITTHVGGGGNFWVTATRPEGPWSDPVWIDEVGIDPSLCFADGALYYTRNGRGADFDHPLIYQGLVDPRSGKLQGKPRVIWRGLGGVWPEAPHLYKIRGQYYLMTAEGGTGYGHSVVVARSPDPFGPFESCPFNPVLTHRDRPDHPIQATGHAELVKLPDGSYWAVLLGIRPSGGRFHHLGRETFLTPVTWTRDGWPRLGVDGTVAMEGPAPKLPATRRRPLPERDDFASRKLRHEWCFVRNPEGGSHSLTARRGRLRLACLAATLGDVASPAAVFRRQQHHRVVCRTSLDFAPAASGDEAGLCVRANEQFHYAIAIRRSGRGREARLVRVVDGRRRTVGRVAVGPGPVVLEISATETDYTFRAGTGRRLESLGTLATRTLAAEHVGTRGQNYFTGVCFGLFATGGGTPSNSVADFDWFDYQPA